MSFEDVRAAVNQLETKVTNETSVLEGQLASVTAERNSAVQSNTNLQSQVSTLQSQLNAAKAQYENHMSTVHPVVTPPVTPPPAPVGKTMIGYSAKQNEWDTEMGKVGERNITARRLFCDLADGGRDNETLIRQAVADGMMPVLSYKVGGTSNVNAAIGGSLDQAARDAGAFLKSLNVPVRFVVWHEPNNDMTPAQFVSLNRRLIPLIKSANVQAGTFINGFLLLNREDDFEAFLADSLVSVCDWVGIDAYHDGSMASPHPTNTPGQRMRLFLAHLKRRNITKPVGIGEYNAFSAEAVRDAGNVVLDNAQIQFACMWSSQVDSTKPDFRLTGARLDAFKATLADSRTLKQS